MKKFVCLLVMSCLSACASFGPIERSSGPSPYNFSVELPEQWTILRNQPYFMFTRSGAFKQYILVQQRHVDKPFKNTRKKINRDMLPQEASEIVQDEVRLDRSLVDFRLIENIPVTVNSLDAFSMVFTYKTPQGLPFKTFYYGLIRGEWYYSLRLNVAQSGYSEDDVDAFRRVLASFKILAG